ncbi:MULTISPECIES: hypothetical protein [Streptomycetaceae]|uniref:hypothetical protein n=1 Tax=Streptomycetaceae TaxID=2062 RepID=UPI00093EE072|nr:hypothetical protein [Streptomyces sp. CB02056]OKH97913.1 hypothetical protein AMK13_37500 [Streptomyces sp. CB02056]
MSVHAGRSSNRRRGTAELVTVIGRLSVDDSVINYSDTFVLAYVGKGLANTQHIFRTVTA